MSDSDLRIARQHMDGESAMCGSIRHAKSQADQSAGSVTIVSTQSHMWKAAAFRRYQIASTPAVLSVKSVCQITRQSPQYLSRAQRLQALVSVSQHVAYTPAVDQVDNMECQVPHKRSAVNDISGQLAP